jgi:hypothetical protein
MIRMRQIRRFLPSLGSSLTEALLSMIDPYFLARQKTSRMVFNSPTALRPAVTFERIGPDAVTGPIRINNALGQNETIEAFGSAVSQLKDARAIILDFRNTRSGGNTDVARSIIGPSIEEPKPYPVHTNPVVERRTTVPRCVVKYATLREPFLDVPVVVLHGKWTASMVKGLVIGSDLADLLGALELELEGPKAWLEFDGERLFHPNGTAREDDTAHVPLGFGDIDPSGDDLATWVVLAPLSEEKINDPSRRELAKTCPPFRTAKEHNGQ